MHLCLFKSHIRHDIHLYPTHKHLANLAVVHISLTSILDTLFSLSPPPSTPCSFSHHTVVTEIPLRPYPQPHLYPAPPPTPQAVRDRLPMSITGWWMGWKVITPLSRVRWSHQPCRHLQIIAGDITEIVHLVGTTMNRDVPLCKICF